MISERMRQLSGLLSEVEDKLNCGYWTGHNRIDKIPDGYPDGSAQPVLSVTSLKSQFLTSINGF